MRRVMVRLAKQCEAALHRAYYLTQHARIDALLLAAECSSLAFGISARLPNPPRKRSTTAQPPEPMPMPLIPPSQIAALSAAAAADGGLLRRTRGPRGAGYQAAPGAQMLHSPQAVIALAREGLLAERAAGFQSEFVITETGRRVVDANARSRQVAR